MEELGATARAGTLTFPGAMEIGGTAITVGWVARHPAVVVLAMQEGVVEIPGFFLVVVPPVLALAPPALRRSLGLPVLPDLSWFVGKRGRDENICAH